METLILIVPLAFVIVILLTNKSRKASNASVGQKNTQNTADTFRFSNNPPGAGHTAIFQGNVLNDEEQRCYENQLRSVTSASFTKKHLMNKEEVQVFYEIENILQYVKDKTQKKYRVMAQVAMGEIMASKDKEAFFAINSKRADFIIINSCGNPIVAVEYQGGGHYQGNAPIREAIKKEALRKAGIDCIEVKDLNPEHIRILKEQILYEVGSGKV
jgi:hypothetical protein